MIVRFIEYDMELAVLADIFYQTNYSTIFFSKRMKKILIFLNTKCRKALGTDEAGNVTDTR